MMCIYIYMWKFTYISKNGNNVPTRHVSLYEMPLGSLAPSIRRGTTRTGTWFPRTGSSSFCPTIQARTEATGVVASVSSSKWKFLWENHGKIMDYMDYILWKIMGYLWNIIYKLWISPLPCLI